MSHWTNLAKRRPSWGQILSNINEAFVLFSRGDTFVKIRERRVRDVGVRVKGEEDLDLRVPTQWPFFMSQSKSKTVVPCTQRRGHAKFGHTPSLSAALIFPRKTGRGRLVTREPQRTVSLSALLYSASVLLKRAALWLQVLGEQTLPVCRARLNSCWTNSVS